jgi:Family of unknown function (DUF5908)
VIAMPIEIRELVIRATVDPGGEPGGCGPSSASKAAGQSPLQAHARGDESVVQTCVREVLRILTDKQER